MTKQEFLDTLAARLQTLPQNEIDKSIQYYDEIINDRIEEGLDEAEAVAALGSIDKTVQDIISEMPISTLIKARITDSRENASDKTLWIAIAIVGIPLWVPLAVAFAVVVLSIYAVTWVIVAALFSVIAALGISCVAGITSGIAAFVTATPASGIFTLGLALMCGAATLFMIKPVILMAKGIVMLTNLIIKKIKSLFIGGKEKAK